MSLNIDKWIASSDATVVARARQPLLALDLAPLRARDRALAEIVEKISVWVQKAGQRDGWGVIGFSF